MRLVWVMLQCDCARVRVCVTLTLFFMTLFLARRGVITSTPSASSCHPQGGCRVLACPHCVCVCVCVCVWQDRKACAVV